MDRLLARRIGYSKAEYLSDLAVHLAGLVAAVACVPALLVLAAYAGRADAAPVTGAAIYGASFLAMIVCSAVYNVFPHPEWEWLLKRLDHSAIYVKIAGTYTGLSLISGGGTTVLPAIWAVSGLGIALKLLSPFRYRTLSIALYLGLGIAIGMFAQGVLPTLPDPAVLLLRLAGLLYVTGLVFYLWERLPFHYTIWHVFVLVASLTVYAGFLVAMTG